MNFSGLGFRVRVRVSLVLRDMVRVRADIDNALSWSGLKTDQAWKNVACNEAQPDILSC